MIYLIEKAWIDPSENSVNGSRGYVPYAYTDSKDVAEQYAKKSYYTKEDCWSINDKMPYFRYSEIHKVNG